MFSTENFYHVLYCNLIKPFNSFSAIAFAPVFENQDVDYLYGSNRSAANDYRNFVLWYDQEPIFDFTINALLKASYNLDFTDDISAYKNLRGQTVTIFANSEISQEKNDFLTNFRLLDWYYFAHGFLALDWYRDFKYLPIDKTASFDKVFITFNHLVSKDRSYRIGLVGDILHRGLDQFGLISFPLHDKYHGSVMNEILDRHSLLDLEHKKIAYRVIKPLTRTFTIDSETVDGSYSANLNLEANQRAFFHLVTETNFYHKKLHLTEKIFKPIVSYRPFILASYAGNLKYLRSYGFKTFGDFIDESYDDEPDNAKRMFMIIDEIEKLCKLSESQQKDMFEAMRPILEHNRNHFYGDFRKVLVHEMVYGFGECIDGLLDDRHIDYSAIAERLIE